MVRYFVLLLALVSVLVLAVMGLRDYSFLPHKTKRPPIEIFPDMVRQPKVKAQATSTFFADGRGARNHVEGTVPAGYSEPGSTMESPYDAVIFSGSEAYADSGKIGTNWGNGLPLAATMATLERGRDRYRIQCAVCHGETGAGNGIATKYGLVGVANLHQQRLRDMSDGEIYNTIVNGKNTMLGYGSVIQVRDRWAIVAYIRALQRAQHATLSDVPAAEKAALTGTNPVAKP